MGRRGCHVRGATGALPALLKRDTALVEVRPQRLRRIDDAIVHEQFGVLLVLGFLFSQSPNPIGFYTFLLLWIMRTSTKLIIFLGAPNAISDLMPKEIAHLQSYFRTDRVTPFFALAMALSCCIFILLWDGAANSEISFVVTGHSLLATFAAIAIVEHLFLILPIRDSALWSWALIQRKAPDEKVMDKNVLIGDLNKLEIMNSGGVKPHKSEYKQGSRVLMPGKGS